MIKIEIKKLLNAIDFPLPAYATSGSAGVDIMAAIEKNIILKPMERVLVPTGIAIALPEGYEAQIRPRSGLAIKNGITVLNTPGTIDSDYRGEIAVIIINFGSSNFEITNGMRIAQMVIMKHERADFSLVAELSSTDRNTGGFGSTGH